MSDVELIANASSAVLKEYLNKSKQLKAFPTARFFVFWLVDHCDVGVGVTNARFGRVAVRCAKI